MNPSRKLTYAFLHVMWTVRDFLGPNCWTDQPSGLQGSRVVKSHPLATSLRYASSACAVFHCGCRATATADGPSHAGCFVSNGTTMLAAAGTDRAAFFEIYIDDDIEVKVCNFKFHVHQKVVVVIPKQLCAISSGMSEIWF